MPHLVLLGDSIFDNGTYVAGGPDVATLLVPLLPPGWTLSLVAVDGATAADVLEQLKRLPAHTTHLVLSAGGNDALMHEHLLHARVSTVAEALLLLADALEGFELDYRHAVASALVTGKDLTVSTIYNANFGDPLQARCTRIAIALYNDVILRVAREHALKSIELRHVCTAAEDYANDIEPSVAGGAKIAAAIVRSLGLAAGVHVGNRAA
jgi:3-polyprenyl-4-hydroxybenzoate decarboxylase